jgi:hypothetical protein
MRTTPLIGKKAWFGPRRLGWGLSPVSPEGWVLTAAAAGAAVWTARAQGAGPARAGIGALVPAVFLVLVFLKGTAPGGRRARAAFVESRAGKGA